MLKCILHIMMGYCSALYTSNIDVYRGIVLVTGVQHTCVM